MVLSRLVMVSLKASKEFANLSTLILSCRTLSVYSVLVT